MICDKVHELGVNSYPALLLQIRRKRIMFFTQSYNCFEVE